MSKTYVKPGDRVEMTLAHSEVCMHMRVAGKRALVEVTTSQHPAAQICRRDGSPFSAPVLLGEAGIFQDDGGSYFYPPEEDAVWI